MARRRTLSTIIALILALALPLQGVSAQVTRCAMNSAGSAADDHAAMAGMQHDASVSSVTTSNDSSQQSSTSDAPCMRTIACVNGPALIAETFVSVEDVRLASPVARIAACLEARELRPDSPPPKN
jgi:hypothetical protein